MASKIAIINMALTRLGQQPIASITEGSEAANIVGRVYDIALEDELRDFPYSFCMTTAELTLLSNETPPDFGYVFQLPADFMGLVSIVDPVLTTTYANREPYALYDNPVKIQYEIREGKLYTDFSEVTIKYKKLETDTTKWDKSFVNAFAWRLAYEIAVPLTADEARATRAQANYVLAIAKAQGKAANEARRTNSLGTRYITARR